MRRGVGDALAPRLGGGRRQREVTARRGGREAHQRRGSRHAAAPAVAYSWALPERSRGATLPSVGGRAALPSSGSHSLEPSAGTPGLAVLRRVIWPLGPEPWPPAEHSCFAGGPRASGRAGRTGALSPGQAWGHALARRPRSPARGTELGAAPRPGESSSPLPPLPSERRGPACRPLGCRGDLLIL